MSRSSRNRRRHSPRGRVVVHNARLPQQSIAWGSLPLFSSSSRFKFRSLRTPPLSEVEDRRLFHPARKLRPAARLNSPNHTLTDSRRTLPLVLSGVGFHDSRRVMICVRRKIRKEVFHALGRAGQGGMRSPKFNAFSDVSCRRS